MLLAYIIFNNYEINRRILIMIKLYDNGVYLVNGSEIVEDNAQALDAV